MPYQTYIPKYGHHKASGQAVVRLDGRYFYLGPYGSAASRQEYDRLVAQWQIAGRCLPESGPKSVAQIMLAYGRYLHQYYHCSRKGFHKDIHAWKMAVRPLKIHYAHLPAAEFSPLKLQAAREDLVRRQLARRTINQHVGRIVRMFKWAVAQELVPGEVLHALRSVEGLRAGHSAARETEPIRPVAWENVEPVLPYVSRQVATMIHLQWITGMRSGEVCRMSMDQLDLTGPVWKYTLAKHKTAYHGHQRMVPLGPKAQEILRPFLKAVPQAYLFSPAEADAERRAALHAVRKTPLCCGNRPGTNRKARPCKKPGDFYGPDEYRHAIHYAITKANRIRAKQLGVPVEKLPAEARVPYWHPHQIRHACATRLRAEFGLEAARAALGHKTISVTQVYAEIDTRKVEKIMAQVG